MPSATTPWLDDDEMQLWRAWLRVQTELPAALGRALHEDSELSLQDFETLVRLSESEEGRLRVSALAEQMHWERSRLSHHLRRMGTRGLVQKVECPEDGRGSFVVLTQAGREALEGAAPDHVRTVRRLFLDGVDADEQAVLLRVLHTVLERLAPA
ncbi:MarR family winged helix-turn-helix transcriptional regulator [Serinicoccus sediminis]|uniref:MarR family winged helix-turn-helix transcriptional regulator n=1 Tax=Serinicoccus sediminis TaxID=2306021 RepID=UPI001EDE6C7F|nr:MarR family transcriptional regulator [Serinicoccus sediminis]